MKPQNIEYAGADGICTICVIGEDLFVRHEVVADTLEEAAARALLRILEQEKGGTVG